jgi:hypothetical protein
LNRQPPAYYLLAEIDALKARCAALESLARASSHGSNIFDPSRNHNLPGSQALGDDSINPYQGVDANDFQGGYHGAAVSPTDLGFQGVDNGAAVSLSSYGMNMGSHHVTPSMGHPPTDDHWQQYFNFDLASSTLPSDQSHDFGPLSPAVGGSYGVSAVDNPASASGGSESAMVATPSRPLYNCTDCMKPFSRLADLRRHARAHNPNAIRFSCSRPGCGRQFLRVDKLSEHCRRKNH